MSIVNAFLQISAQSRLGASEETKTAAMLVDAADEVSVGGIPVGFVSVTVTLYPALAYMNVVAESFKW